MIQRWTKHEDAALTRLYGNGVAVRTIAERLGRTVDAANARRIYLNIPSRRASTSWSEREDVVLAAATRAGLPAWVVAERLGRPVGQIRWRRRTLGLAAPAARPYSATDDEAIRLVFRDDGDVQELATRLGRTPEALRLRAVKLGAHRPVRRRRWSTGEDAAVRDGYDSGLSCAEIARELPGRTPAAVTARARKLGLATHARRWTAPDDERLRRLAGRYPLEELARRLGRTPDAMRQRASKLGLAPLAGGSSPRAGTPWTGAEDELLRLHAGLNPGVLGPLLGRSDRAVTIRLSKLGLRAGRERSPHHTAPRFGAFTAGERALLERELEPDNPRQLVTVARRLGLSSTALAARLPRAAVQAKQAVRGQPGRPTAGGRVIAASDGARRGTPAPGWVPTTGR
jgi:hypothetical protein